MLCRHRMLCPHRLASIVLAVFVAWLLAEPAAARDAALVQSAGASLRVTVTDATGAVIVGARVVVRQDGGLERDTTTDGRGEAAVTGLGVGTAEIRVESDGFEPRTMSRRLRAGMNRAELRLELARLAVTVEVSRDAREKGLDPRGDAFARVLTADQIAMLPDDPDELARVLEQMAGPGAVFRVNGFGGGRLPPKGQIRQIRFSLNTFSAEMHELGMPVVDITTQPGLDRWHTSLSGGFRNDALTAHYAYAPTSASEQVHRGGLTIDGPLWRNHTSVAVTADSLALADSQTILASTPGGPVGGSARRPTARTSFGVEIEHALTSAHTSRVELTRQATRMDNLGVGGASLAERAYSSDQTGYTLRVSDSGPLGKRLFNELRLQSVWSRQRTESATFEPSVIVLDAFSNGGAQVDSSRRSWDLEVADNVDASHGRHAMRSGVLVQAGRYRSVDGNNRLGTFTFSELDAYAAGRPTLFTQRVGNPLVEYGFYRAGWYVQDDVRLHKSFTGSVGVRHEFQSHVAGRVNLAPRAGFTWAPRPNAELLVRGGAGIVYNWFEPSVYEQTLRVDGLRQYDIVVVNPGFPDAFDGALPIVLPPSRLVQAPDLRLPRILSASIAVERRVRLLTMVRANYTHQRGRRLFRGHNLNAPLPDGSRPFPELGNVTRVESAGRSSLDRLDVGFSHGVMKNMKVLYLLAVTYSLARQQNDTDGPFSPPSDNANPAADWGPAATDVRHRLNGMVNATLPAGLRAMLMASASSAPPYNVTTGTDDNHDTAINDRPAGTGRNSARGAGQVEVIARVSWAIGFGKAPAAPPGIPNVRRLGREAERDPLGAVSRLGSPAHRYRIELYVQSSNLLNRVNAIGFRGVLTSPFFGQATASLPPRRIEIGTRFDF